MADPWMLCPYGCNVPVVEGIGRDQGRYHCRICQRCVSAPSLAFAAYNRGVQTGVKAFKDAVESTPPQASDTGKVSDD